MCKLICGLNDAYEKHITYKLTLYGNSAVRVSTSSLFHKTQHRQKCVKEPLSQKEVQMSIDIRTW